MTQIIFTLVVFLIIYLICRLVPILWLKVAIIGVLVFLSPFLFIQTFLLERECTKLCPKTALVLGAGITNNQYPTQILRLRLDKAVEMYQANQITNIIVSGDNSREFHNEPLVMKNYLVKNGVLESAIKQDFGGRRTMDSCYRVKNYFKVNDAFVITQRFHISRAKFLCESVGLPSSIAVAADTGPSTVTWGYLREIPASWSAIKDSFYFVPQVGSDGSEGVLN